MRNRYLKYPLSIFTVGMDSQGLRRTLSLFDAFSIGINAIVGAGIFVVIGIAAGAAGPALILSIIISFVISTFTALSFVRLSKLITKEGGAYEFAHELLPAPLGFLTGWLWLFSNIIGGAAVAMGFAQYLSFFIPVGDYRFVAAAISLAVTLLNYYGVKGSALVGDAVNIVKMGILALFVIVGIFFIDLGNFTPFAPKGLGGAVTGAALFFFAFTGFGRIATVSEEVKNPQRTVPRAIILSLAVSSLIYVLVAFVALGLIGYSSLSVSSFPLAEAILRSGIWGIGYVITVGALVATFGVLLTSVLGVSRVAFAMSRNRDLPILFSRVHEKYRIPHYAVIFSGLIMVMLAGLSSFNLVINASSATALIYYALSNASAFRSKDVRSSNVIPFLGVISCLAILVFLSLNSLLLTLIIVCIGMIYYLAKRRWHTAGVE
jgi:APA family basic amino acid/polyamine antiporter